jgi:mono/diheme cytochrome c family protein
MRKRRIEKRRDETRTILIRKRGIRAFGFFAGALALGALIRPPGACAQEEHRHAHAPESAKRLKNPLPATAENISAGGALFRQNCSPCHGLDGRAKTEIAAAMKTKPADLTGRAVRDLVPGEIYWVVTHGIEASGMPAFEGKASEPERWKIVLYVRSLSGAPSPAGPPVMEGGAHAGHEMMGLMTSTVTGGPFRAMSAIGSGTSLQPASTPMAAWHWMPGAWTIMLHGEVKAGYNRQGGPRGVTRAESENWLMLMAERNAGPGRLMLRAMLSAEPLTAPRGGFPELFQTGETYRRQPIIDAQHPHDGIMELAASYTIPISERASFQIYGGPVAEPALGPVAFMHRASAIENPSAPLGHHWQDSTHITHGVVTAALTAGRFKFEASGFHGAEPDEDRLGLDMGKLDSYSVRGWFTPTPHWALQFSVGHLTEPEAIESGDLDRKTASVSYNRPFKGGNLAASLIWGRNSEEHGKSDSYLLETTVDFLGKNHLYARFELVDKAGLLVDNIFGRPGLARAPMIPADGGEVSLPAEFERSFRVAAFTFGAVRDIIDRKNWRAGIGADIVFYRKPAELDPIYGRRPASFHLFLRIRPGEVH